MSKGRQNLRGFVVMPELDALSECHDTTVEIHLITECTVACFKQAHSRSFAQGQCVKSSGALGSLPKHNMNRFSFSLWIPTLLITSSLPEELVLCSHSFLLQS